MLTKFFFSFCYKKAMNKTSLDSWYVPNILICALGLFKINYGEIKKALKFGLST